MIPDNKSHKNEQASDKITVMNHVDQVELGPYNLSDEWTTINAWNYVKEATERRWAPSQLNRINDKYMTTFEDMVRPLFFLTLPWI